MIFSQYNIIAETKANNDISWIDCLCGPKIYLPLGDGAIDNFSLGVFVGAFVFGLVEIILGSHLFNTFKHVRLGAWWVGVAGWACFILIYSYRLNFSLFMSFCMAGIAFYGAFLDARSSQHFSSITACASQVDFNSEITYYGKSSDFPAARSCFNSTEFTVLDGCYCVSNNDPGTCNEYITNAFFKNNNGKGKNMVYYTCYETVKIFSGRMTASCVFCCLLLFVAILQILIVCLLYPKRKPGVYIVKDQLSVREIEA